MPPHRFLTIDKKTVELTGKQLNQQQLLSEQLFDQEANEDEDFEIPAFLRRQKF